MFNVAVIDDGINEGLYGLNSLEFNMEINQKLEIKKRSGYDKYMSSHATICAAIIKKYSPQAYFSSVKILNDKRRGLREQLTKAIEWCSKTGIKVINLSLGTVCFNDCKELLGSVNKAAQNGVIIVAACSNRMVMTYPASFTNVIGVKTDFCNALREGEFIYNYYPNDGIDITCCSAFLLNKYNGESYCTKPCNSFAAPFITAMVLNIVEMNPNITTEEVKLQLADRALNNGCKPGRMYLYKHIDWIRKAVLINFNNPETKFQKENLDFKAVASINSECDCYCSGAEKIKKIRDDGYFENCDTVVIDADNIRPEHDGCTGEAMIQDIINLGKNVIYLDDKKNMNLNLTIPDKKIKIWHPTVLNFLNLNSYGELDIPLINIVDFTGSNVIEIIGKLQKSFRKDGYNIVASSNVCRGILEGIHYSPDYVLENGKEMAPKHLRTLYEVLNPDVMIYGQNAGKRDAHYLNCINNIFEVDIFIVIAEEFNEDIKMYFRLLKNRDNRLIVLIPGNVEGKVREEEIQFFDLSESCCADEVYSCIIKFYES